ncbi:MAG: hypothetical protein ACLUOI_31310 [Eisenbergiella sp.]
MLEQMNVDGAKNRMPSKCPRRGTACRQPAMIHEPGIVFADEPTGALNRQNTGEVLGLLTSLNKEGQSILMVTHDLRAAIRGTRILYLEDGSIRDELELPVYNPDDEKERENTVNEWLASFRW